MERIFMTSQYSYTKRYEKIRKLETGQIEGYTRGCLLDYEYIRKSL